MNRFKKALLTVGLVASTLFIGTSALAVNVEQRNLTNYGTQGYNNYPQVIVSHESGNANNTSPNAVYNEMAFMERRWRETGGNSETAHYWVGSGGKAFQLVPDRMVAFHAGTWANYNAIGIELARTNNKEQFKKDYATYVNLHRQLAIKYGIPLTLDDGSYKGIKSHLWISNNIWGDHADPYGYLSSMGISKAQFAKDLRNGVNAGNVEVNKPQINSEQNVSTTTIKKGAKVEVKNAIQYGTNKPFYANGVYDVIEVNGNRVVIGKGNVVTTAIHSNNLKYANSKPSTPTPSPQVTSSNGWYKESATFNPNYAIIVRYNASLSAKISGTLYPNQAIKYDAVKQAEGYVWIKYESYTGTRYMPVRPIGGQAWGTFK